MAEFGYTAKPGWGIQVTINLSLFNSKDGWGLYYVVRNEDAEDYGEAYRIVFVRTVGQLKLVQALFEPQLK